MYASFYPPYSEWKAYKLARVWQINKLCEILQIMK